MMHRDNKGVMCKYYAGLSSSLPMLQGKGVKERKMCIRKMVQRQGIHSFFPSGKAHKHGYFYLPTSHLIGLLYFNWLNGGFLWMKGGVMFSLYPSWYRRLTLTSCYSWEPTVPKDSQSSILGSICSCNGKEQEGNSHCTDENLSEEIPAGCFKKKEEEEEVQYKKLFREDRPAENQSEGALRDPRDGTEIQGNTRAHICRLRDF